MLRKRVAFLFLMSLSALYACDMNSGGIKKVNFDRIAMYENIADHIIMPALNNFSTELENLNHTIETFVTNTDSLSLANLQNQWKIANLAWQRAEVYSYLTPGSTHSLVRRINTIPTDTTAINELVINPNQDINLSANWEAIGFPSLDFLLFGNARTVKEQLHYYTVERHASNRLQLIRDLVANMKTVHNRAMSEWQNHYLTEFKTSDGTGASATLTLLATDVATWLDNFEKLRYRLPMNVTSEGVKLGNVKPKNLEAPNSEYSKELSAAGIKEFYNFYMGIGKNGDGPGFYDYLIEIDPQPHAQQKLADLIKAELKSAIDRNKTLQQTTKQALHKEFDQLTSIFRNLRKTIVYYKVDMATSFGISIANTDNDND